MKRMLVNAFLVCGFVVGADVFAYSYDNNYCIPVNNYSHEEISSYFTSYADKAATTHVKYFQRKNELIFYACPSALDDFLLGLFSLVTSGAAIGFGSWLTYLAKKEYKPNAKAWLIFPALGVLTAGGFTALSVAMWYTIIKHYKLRNDFVPYLTCDSVGLKKFNEYVLKWAEIDRVENGVYHKTEFVGFGDTVQAVDSIYYSTSYCDKFGELKFMLVDSDSMLPVGYESIRVVLNHCLAYYGNAKFRI